MLPDILIVSLGPIGLGLSSVFGGPCRTPALERLMVTGIAHSRMADRRPNAALSDLVQARRYRTAYFGSCEKDPLDFGAAFERMEVLQDETLQFGRRETPSCHFTECMTSRALEWLCETDGDRPSFLCWSPPAPRHEANVPPGWARKYAGRFSSSGDEGLAGWLDYVDYHLGRLISDIEDRGRFDDCLVVVTAGQTAEARADVDRAQVDSDPDAALALVRSRIAAMGGADNYLDYARGWAHAPRRASDWTYPVRNGQKRRDAQLIVKWPGHLPIDGGVKMAVRASDIESLIARVAGACRAEHPDCVVYPFSTG